MDSGDKLIEMFKDLRDGPGATVGKLGAERWAKLLGYLLTPGDPVAGLAALEDVLHGMTDQANARIARVALAVGLDDDGLPMSSHGGLVARRQWASGEEPFLEREKRFFKDGSSRTHQRREDRKAFPALADAILKRRAEGLADAFGHTQSISLDDDNSTNAATEEEAASFPDSQPVSEANEALTIEGKSKHSLWSLIHRHYDRAIQSDDTHVALLVALCTIAGAFITVGIMKVISPDKNDLINDALKGRYAKLDPKPHQFPNAVLAKVPVAVSGQPSADQGQGWGPERPTFTMKKPAPYPVLNSIADHDRHGDERNFVQCRDRENSTWGTEVSAREDHTYQCYIWFDNAVAPNLDDKNSAAKLHDTRVRVRLPVNQANNPSLVGILSAADSMTVWSSCVFASSQPVTITYQRGSARVHMLPYDNTSGRPQLAETFNGDTAASGITTPSGALLGEENLDGVISQNAGYVLFDVKVNLE
ncbi:hypothetical protein [Streptomyces sp. NBC_01439]|uniref:hypothetical protein n=1 Tax=Streptomyces sp. NBC_01439 TaxID=2903867 RepID=UPI002E2DF7F2|nr:hypothetical protein [Streptomyces sp. NBC_01439]